MYRVRQKGQVLETFHLFVDAWLYVYLELDTFAVVTGPDGIWPVNPGQHRIN